MMSVMIFAFTNINKRRYWKNFDIFENTENVEMSRI